jgi:hypothetical protein
MALHSLCWALAFFQFLNPIQSRSDSLEGGSACRRVAAYTQGNINRIISNIHVLNVIRTRAHNIRARWTVHAIDRATTVIDRNLLQNSSSPSRDLNREPSVLHCHYFMLKCKNRPRILDEMIWIWHWVPWNSYVHRILSTLRCPLLFGSNRIWILLDSTAQSEAFLPLRREF